MKYNSLHSKGAPLKIEGKYNFIWINLKLSIMTLLHLNLGALFIIGKEKCFTIPFNNHPIKGVESAGMTNGPHPPLISLSSNIFWFHDGLCGLIFVLPFGNRKATTCSMPVNTIAMVSQSSYILRCKKCANEF